MGLKFIGNATAKTRVQDDNGEAVKLPQIILSAAEVRTPLLAVAEKFGEMPSVSTTRSAATMKKDKVGLGLVQDAEGLSVKETMLAHVASRIQAEKKFLESLANSGS